MKEKKRVTKISKQNPNAEDIASMLYRGDFHIRKSSRHKHSNEITIDGAIASSLDCSLGRRVGVTSITLTDESTVNLFISLTKFIYRNKSTKKYLQKLNAQIFHTVFNAGHGHLKQTLNTVNLTSLFYLEDFHIWKSSRHKHSNEITVYDAVNSFLDYDCRQRVGVTSITLTDESTVKLSIVIAVFISSKRSTKKYLQKLKSFSESFSAAQGKPIKIMHNPKKEEK